MMRWFFPLIALAPSDRQPSCAPYPWEHDDHLRYGYKDCYACPRPEIFLRSYRVIWARLPTEEVSPPFVRV